MIRALRETKTRLRHLDNLGSALHIQYVSSAKKSRERAAVRAVADESIVDSRALKMAADDAAFTLNWMHVHFGTVP